MPEYIQLEIDQARREARAQVADETDPKQGVSRESILSWMTRADTRLQSHLLTNCPHLTLFLAQEEISLVAEQRDYALASDSYNSGDIVLVEYSYNGDANCYVPIRPVTLFELSGARGADICNYQLFGNKLRVTTPTQAGGKIRVTYNAQLDSLQIRRGTIDSTPNSGGEYDQIVLEDDDVLHEDMFSRHSYLCVNDADGTVIRRNIGYSAYDSTTRTFTLVDGVAIADGAISAGQYVTVGKNTTTHSKLPKICDDFRITMAAKKLLNVNSSLDAIEESEEMQAILADIVEKLQTRVHGPQGIPVINSDWR